jgi:hypothetical protein
MMEQQTLEFKPDMNLVILDAIKSIIRATDNEVTYDVNTSVESSLFSKKDAIKRTTVTITITEKV